MRWSALSLFAVAGLSSSVPPARMLDAQTPGYARSSVGTRSLTSASGLTIKVLLEQANLGSGEVEVAEITLPPAPNAASHAHASSEILYILSGELDHVVNDTSHLLRAGMLGVVRPGDRVAHRVHGTEPVRALVIWTPGGEVDRLARSPAFRVEAIRQR